MGKGRPMPAPPPRRRRRRETPLIDRRLLWRGAALAAGAAVLLYAGLATLIDGPGFRPSIEAALSTATGRRTTIGSLHFSLLRRALVARDLRIAEDPAFGGSAPFLEAPTVYFKASLLSLLFSHEPQIKTIAFLNPAVTLRQDAGGSWSYYSLLHASTASVADLNPPAIAVTGGRLDLIPYGGDSSPIQLRNLRLTSPAASLQMNNPFTLAGSVMGGGSFNVEGRAGPMQWDISRPMIPISALLHASKVDLGRARFFATGASVAGLLSLDFSIESDGRLLRLDGQAKAEKLRLSASGSPASEPAQAVFTLSEDLNTGAGTLNRCDFRVSKGSASLTGKFSTGSAATTLDLRLDISDAPATGLAPYLPTLGFPLPGSAGMVGGSVSSALQVHGTLDRPLLTGSMSVIGARLTGFDLSHRLAPVDGLNATGLESEFEVISWQSSLKTAPQGLNLENLQIAIAGLGSLSGHGTIASDGGVDFQMSGIRGLTGPKGTPIPFVVRGSTRDPVFLPGASHSVFELPGPEAVLMLRHVHALAHKADAFHFEPHPLFESGFEAKLDLSPGSHHPLPGQRAVAAAQHGRHMPVVERISCRGGHLSVGRDLALGDLPDGLAERRVALLALGRPHQPAFQLAAALALHRSSLCRKQPVRWSFTMPVACMNE